MGTMQGGLLLGSIQVGATNRRAIRITGLVFLGLMLALNSGCASKQATEKAPNPDPFEPVNRQIYRFNDTADRFVLRPVGKGYNFITPRPVRTGVSNFFDNVTYPITIVNDFLQGKVGQGFEDTGRFVVNTTLGILGLFDVATEMGLQQHEEDFGQTFAKWGLPAGPYLVIPLFGPRTVRSGIGNLADIQVNPLMQYNNTSVRDKLLLLWAVETRAALIGPDELVFEAFDPYLFVRDAYLQNREYMATDGESAGTDADFEEGFDDGLEDDF
jgi:phospholipid-binding lipoprotein MlaA